MTTITDIIQHIAQALTSDERSVQANVKQLLTDRFNDTHLCITADVEGTELAFLESFGRGDTFYFRLNNREHGLRLANELFRRVWNTYPELSCKPDDTLLSTIRLYLFIHIRRRKRTLLRPRFPAIGSSPLSQPAMRFRLTL